MLCHPFGTTGKALETRKLRRRLRLRAERLRNTEGKSTESRVKRNRPNWENSLSKYHSTDQPNQGRTETDGGEGTHQTD